MGELQSSLQTFPNNSVVQDLKEERHRAGEVRVQHHLKGRSETRTVLVNPHMLFAFVHKLHYLQGQRGDRT